MAGPLEDAMTWLFQQGQKRNEERLKKENPTLYYARQRKKNERPAEIKQGRSKESRQLARTAGAIVTNEDVEKAKKQQEILSTFGYPSFNGEITPENYQYARGALDAGRSFGEITSSVYSLPFHVATGNAVNSIVGNAVRLIPKAVKFASPIARPIVTGVISAAPEIVQAADGKGMTSNKPLDVAIAAAIGAGSLPAVWYGGKYLIPKAYNSARKIVKAGVNAFKNNTKIAVPIGMSVAGGTVGGIVGANMYDDEEPQTGVNINQGQQKTTISNEELDSILNRE